MSSKEDTTKLLLECDAGVKTAVNSIDEVLDKAQSDTLHDTLRRSRDEHVGLMTDIADMLKLYDGGSKEPNPMARAMSKMKIDTQMLLDPTDAKIADLMMDGCNMGIKSLYRYINEYKTADHSAKEIASKLINLEQQLADQMHPFL